MHVVNQTKIIIDNVYVVIDGDTVAYMGVDEATAMKTVGNLYGPFELKILVP